MSTVTKDRKALPAAPNIEASPVGCLMWDANDTAASLQRLLDYVESEAHKAAAWYLTNKRSKSTWSRAIQMSALILTALGGIFPVASFLLKNMHWPFLSESGLWSSLFVGLAAALIGLDRAFGFSSGWARYIMTATSIRKALEEFRMDWLMLASKASAPLTPEQIAELIQLSKKFRISVETMVIEETKDWVAEFQSSMANLEKDIKSQLDALKTQVDKGVQERLAAASPGSIEATVSNLDKIDDKTVVITLEGPKGIEKEETVVNMNKWVGINIGPGQYKLTAKGKVNGNPISAVTAVIVVAGEVSKPQLAFSV